MAGQQRQHAWVLIFISLVVASFLGGAIRVLLSPDHVRSWIESIASRNNLKFDFQFDHARLALSDGAMPLFGVEISGLSLKAKDPCVTRSEIYLSKVYVPLSLAEFFGGTVKFGVVEVDELTVNLMDAFCDSPDPHPLEVAAANMAPPSGSSTTLSKENKFEERAKSFFRHRFKKEMVNSRRWLDGLIVHRLYLNRQREQSQASMGEFREIEIIIPDKDAPLVMGFQWEFSPEYFWNLKGTKFVSKFKFWEEKAEIYFNGIYKEGRVETFIDVDIPQWKFVGEMQHSNVPVEAISTILYKSKLTEQSFSPQLFWFNCHLRAEGPLEEWGKQSVKVSSCSMSGKLGHIRLQSFIFNLYPFSVTEGLILDVEKLDLNRLASGTKMKWPAQVLTQPGKLTAKVFLNSWDVFRARGKIEGLAATFSRGGRKREQLANVVEFGFEKKDQRISGIIEKVDLQNGHWKGEMSFNFKESLDDGVLQFNVKELIFNPEVQSLLSGQTVGRLEVYGKAKVKGGFLEHWRGNIGLDEVAGSDWEAEKVSLAGDFVGNEFKGQLKMGLLEIKKGHRHQEWLRPLFLDYENVRDQLEFEDLVFNLQLNGSEGKWQRSQAKSDKILFSTEGHWDKSGAVQGKIVVDFPALKLLQWDLEGDLSRPKILPSSKMLKELAKKDPSSEGAEPRMKFLREILAKEKVSSLKQLGKEVLQRAKNMLPQDVKRDDELEPTKK